MTKDLLARWGIAWPDAHPDTGEPFVGVDGFCRSAHVERVHHMPIGYPSRKIATAWETVTVSDEDWDDEIEVPTAWRELDDAEWAAARANYEKHKDDTFALISHGPDTIEGTFETASGATARGVYDSVLRKWAWHETTRAVRRGSRRCSP